MKRRHHRLLSVLAFGLLALVVELAGRSLTHRLDVGRHVGAPAYANARYYPFLLMAVKGGIALLLARLTWRFARARATAAAGRRVVAALGQRPADAPRVRLELSPRLWLASFALSAGIYLVQADAEAYAAHGLGSPLGPWLHSSALPVFAVISVVAAVLWRVVQRWLAEYETYARESAAYARSLALDGVPSRPRARSDETAPRRLHGIAFASRPPPAPA